MMNFTRTLDFMKIQTIFKGLQFLITFLCIYVNCKNLEVVRALQFHLLVIDVNTEADTGEFFELMCDMMPAIGENG